MSASHPALQPSLRDESRLTLVPGVETPGYFRSSLWDEEAASRAILSGWFCGEAGSAMRCEHVWSLEEVIAPLD